MSAVSNKAPLELRRRKGLGSGDPLFLGITLVLACSVVVVVVLMLVNMTVSAGDSLSTFGFGFLTGQLWDPVHTVVGALPFIFSTLVTLLMALILGGLVGLGCAIF